MRSLVLAIGSLVLLSACGTKGPLVLPPEPQQPVQASSAATAPPAPAANNPSTAKEQP